MSVQDLGASSSFQTTFLYYNIGIFKIGIGKYRQLIQFPPKRNPAASQFESNWKTALSCAKPIRIYPIPIHPLHFYHLLKDKT